MHIRMTFVISLLALACALAAQNTGGPDNFGYTFANSNAVGGPEYSWVTPSGANEISGLIDDAHDGPFPIGFNFPFYDGAYNQFWIDSNGYISFNELLTYDLSPDSIPNPNNTPNNFIAWMWMDLDPADDPDSTTHVYYENLDDSFLLTFVEYHDYPGEENDWITAQIRLYENGDILLQYNTITDSFDIDNEACVGIENVDGSDGLQYAFEQQELFSNEMALKFTRPAPPSDDLQALGIGGNTMPNVGTEEQYTVNVRNVGVNAQSDYTVKLWLEGDVLAGEVDGPTIQSGEILDVNIPWTPAAAGATYLWGEVVLDGDEDPDNDNSEQLDVYVMPEGIVEVEIGDGTDHDRDVPFDYFYKNSLAETLYYPEEMNGAGDIYGIIWFNHFTSDDAIDKPIAIWMGHTTLDSLGAGFIASTELTQVYSGNVTMPLGDNEILVNLDTPFFYNGTDNLVVLTHRPMDTEYFDTTDHFYYTETLDYPSRSIEYEHDSIVIDPANPPVIGTTNVSTLDNVPNTVFLIQSGTTTGVQGYVLDTNSTPISGATVQVSGGDSYTTGDNGRYEFEMEAGTYTLTASATGYVTATAEDVVVVQDEMTQLSFNLNQMIEITVEVTCNDSGSPDGAAVTLTNGTDTFSGNVGAAGSIAFENVPTGDNYELTVTLTGYTDYNETGISITATATLPAQLVEIIAAPTNLTCDNGGLFNWDAPAVQTTRHNNVAQRAESMDRSLEGYNVYLDGSLVAEDVTNTFYQFTDLDNFTEYTAGVEAVFTTGTSSLITVDFTYGEELVPPTNAACTAHGVFTWDAPARDLTGYNVYLDGTMVTYTGETTYTFTGLTNGQQYTASVAALYDFGQSTAIEVQFTYDETGVGNEDIPAVNAWRGNFPNPFNPSTTLRFDLAEPQNVRIDIFNSRGQKVCTLLNEAYSAGHHTATWNGTNENGQTMPSGIYMGRIVTPSFSSTFKMIMMK